MNRARRRSLGGERGAEGAEFERRVETYRGAIGRYLDQVSLRQAAREIGMSPTGVQKFIDGSQPYLSTVRELREWYQGRHAAPDAASD